MSMFLALQYTGQDELETSISHYVKITDQSNFVNDVA